MGFEYSGQVGGVKVEGSRKVSIIGLRALREEAMKVHSLSKVSFLRSLLFFARKISGQKPDEHALRNVLSFVIYDVYHSQIQEVRELKRIVYIRCLQLEKGLQKIHERVSEVVEDRIPEFSKILTHSYSTTVVKSLIRAHDQNKKISVVCCETRPLFQGVKTARILSSRGIPTTLIVDSAARHFMKNVDLVLLGADTIVSNGGVINRIGSGSIAALAHEQKKPLIIVSGSYKFNPVSMEEFQEPSQEGSPEEIVKAGALPKVKIKNPSSELIPPRYIDLIATEFGVVPPGRLFGLLSEKFAWLGKDHSIIKNLL